MPEHRIDSVESFCKALEELARIKINPNTVRHHLREWCREGVLSGTICERTENAKNTRRRRARRRARG